MNTTLTWTWFVVRCRDRQNISWSEFGPTLGFDRQVFRYPVCHKRGILQYSYIIGHGYVASANAAVASWPAIDVLHCWPHVSRNCGLKAPKPTFKAIFEPAIVWLRSCRSRDQLKALGEIVVTNWTNLGYGDYARWFHNYCLVEPWTNWFVCASTVAGVSPNQNPIESHHQVIKQLVELHSPTVAFLETTLKSTCRKLLNSWSILFLYT